MITARDNISCTGLIGELFHPRPKYNFKFWPNRPRLVVTGMVLTVFWVGFLITFYYSQVFALGHQIDSLNRELTDLRIESSGLNKEIRSLSSLDRIECLATEKLGMVRAGTGNITMVHVNR